MHKEIHEMKYQMQSYYTKGNMFSVRFEKQIYVCSVTSVLFLLLLGTDYNSNNLHNINFQVAIIITFKFFLCTE